MDNFKAVYKILKYLEKAMDYDEADMSFISAEKFGISENRWIVIMQWLVREDYITGVEIRRSVDGEYLLSYDYPQITMKGAEYLEENSLMRKIADTAKGISDIIK